MSNKIMTLGVFAHANAGKTTITEQLLYHTNVKRETGRVDHGNTTTDNLKVEQDRGISVRACMVTLPLNDKTVQLIDTPGHVDFSAEVERAMNVLDGAILVVSGVEGIEPQTQVIWKILKERKVPTLIFINKMDRLGADYQRVLEEMQRKLDSNIIPMITVKQVGKGTLEYEEKKIENIIEELANIDDHILEKYINNEKISREWLEEQVTQLTHNGSLYFVYGGSALLDEGILKLIEGIDKYLPTSSKKKTDDFSGYVYTVKRDTSARELYVKILDGDLKNRQEVELSNGVKQRIRTLTRLEGTKRTRCEELKTGEIGIMTGIDAKCGDMIGKKQNFKRASFINPLFHTTVDIEDKTKLHDLANALTILCDEDPSLNLCFNKDTGQISIDLMGPLQAEIIENLLLERFNIKPTFSDPIIIHKETPTQSGRGSTTFNRVSGVELEVNPLPRGSGLVVNSKYSTDYLFPKYQKQIDRLIKMWSTQGLYGWEVTDAEISIIGGKCDSVCSDPSHFNIATPIALMRALKEANMELLEPIMNFEILAPIENRKQIVSLGTAFGAEYEKIEERNGYIVLSGNSPLREIVNLPTIVTKATGGHGSVIKKPNGYDLRKDCEYVEKTYLGPDPRNEEAFMMDMGVSKENLDRTLKKK